MTVPLPLQVTALTLTALLAGAKGWHLTASIGGADMPVVITLLNSYSGRGLTKKIQTPWPERFATPSPNAFR
jgi:NAD/NADP transhydrogenase beta subunit